MVQGITVTEQNIEGVLGYIKNALRRTSSIETKNVYTKRLKSAYKFLRQHPTRNFVEENNTILMSTTSTHYFSTERIRVERSLHYNEKYISVRNFAGVGCLIEIGNKIYIKSTGIYIKKKKDCTLTDHFEVWQFN